MKSNRILLSHVLRKLGHMALGICATIAKILFSNGSNIKSYVFRKNRPVKLTVGSLGVHPTRFPYGGAVSLLYNA